MEDEEKNETGDVSMAEPKEKEEKKENNNESMSSTEQTVSSSDSMRSRPRISNEDVGLPSSSDIQFYGTTAGLDREQKECIPNLAISLRTNAESIRFGTNKNTRQNRRQISDADIKSFVKALVLGQRNPLEDINFKGANEDLQEESKKHVMSLYYTLFISIINTFSSYFQNQKAANQLNNDQEKLKNAIDQLKSKCETHTPETMMAIAKTALFRRLLMIWPYDKSYMAKIPKGQLLYSKRAKTTFENVDRGYGLKVRAPIIAKRNHIPLQDDVQRFKILMGSVKAGNSSRTVKKELKELCNQLKKENRITRDFYVKCMQVTTPIRKRVVRSKSAKKKMLQ
jgi:hypothetical protein